MPSEAREKAAHHCVSLERAECPSPVQHEVHAGKKFERKEGVWFGSLL